ncbi:hypothetical protein D3C73_1361460 [compost metagenome]
MLNRGTSVSVSVELSGIIKSFIIKSMNGLIAPVSRPDKAPAIAGIAIRKAFFTNSRFGSHTVVQSIEAVSVTLRNVLSNSAKAQVIWLAITGANDWVNPTTREGMKSPRAYAAMGTRTRSLRSLKVLPILCTDLPIGSIISTNGCNAGRIPAHPAAM